MRSNSPGVGDFSSKIASIQEKSNFPEAAWTLPASDIDLPLRSPFARHTLVGLNLFLLKMAEEFPLVFGIPTQDPMMGNRGLDPLKLTERAITEQAAMSTASIGVPSITLANGKLTATVTVRNAAGHKLPSGVGFRRLFVEFTVLDAAGKVLWESGRTDPTGTLVDRQNTPLPGERWWTPDCSARLPTAYQPHREVIRAENEVQVYQEVTLAPATTTNGKPPVCGEHATPGGQATTSFLSICARPKDNRLLPDGFLSLADRQRIATAFGADKALAEEAGPAGVGKDPDYVHGGGDSLQYQIDATTLNGKPASVRAVLYSQSTPPSFLQDRFCTSKSPDTDRLYYLTGNLNLADTRAEGWKLEVVSSGRVLVPG